MKHPPEIGSEVLWGGRKVIVIPTKVRRFTYKPELYVSISFDGTTHLTQVQFGELSYLNKE